MAPTSTVQTLPTTVLGKRKTPATKSLVLHLSSPESTYTPLDSDLDPIASTSNINGPPILVNGSLIPFTTKRYRCTYEGCDKAYSKPTRLAEHERSHTGQRPFICESCSKSYLRETHLHAHARTHLPESARPLPCEQTNCMKRFWTSQHLRVHMDWHNGSKSFLCSEPGCTEAFAKHHQLRNHACTAHAPPGTKPYQCEHESCTRSFATNQHLRTHAKIHDSHRYTCVQIECIMGTDGALKYFPTWTALQHHIRTVHPPTCSHVSCNGRVFTSQKGLRAHQKLHQQRDFENQIEATVVYSGDENEDDSRPAKKRRGGEIGRDWKCDISDCGKDFKSKRALATHTNVTHLGQRNFACPHDDCRKKFGYKHLLQRHLAKVHDSAASESSDEDVSSGKDDRLIENTHTRKIEGQIDIDAITGNAYIQKAKLDVSNAKALRCPYPSLEDLAYKTPVTLNSHGSNPPQALIVASGIACDYVFTRAYDLRRHLRSTHDIDAEKDYLDDWVKKQKQKQKVAV